MSCLFHYNLDVSLVMRFLGGNYTAAHRHCQSVATRLLTMGIPAYLVQQYVRVMTVGCPTSINADVSRAIFSTVRRCTVRPRTVQTRTVL